MNHESLEQQTAPESTRGLFDDDEEQAFSKRRSVSLRPSNIQLRPQTVMMSNNHQRHNTNNKQRRRPQSTILNSTPLRQSLDKLNEESNMTMDSLRDMIQTLKGLPPHIINKPSNGGDPHSLSAGLDRQPISREAAFAEAEAKLMGTFSNKDTKKRASNNRYSFQQPLPSLSENQQRRSIELNKRNQKSLSLSLNNSRQSRNFEDWRHSNRASFHLVPFTPTRVQFTREDANPHQRRPLFIAHLPFSALMPLFRSRQLVRGYLRVNKRNRNDAYVSCDDLDQDIYICGSRNRNRALEGDVVAVRLVNVDSILQEKQEKEEAKLARNRHNNRLPDEEDENEIMFGGDEETDIVRPKYAGVVVAILERAQNQVFSGILTLKRPSNQKRMTENDEMNAPRIAWFKATDKRVPLIAIPIEQVPDDFVENSNAYANRLFVGSIKRWPITSLHPFGTLERELGYINDVNVQIQAILADNNITDTDFSSAVMQCFPPAPFKFTTSDESRRDMTKENHRLIAIDPEEKFPVYENGLSIVQLDNDTFEVGVHVVDISYFIKPNSALDKEARARSIAVAMDQKFIPMLPNELVEVAQFKLGELKPAVSVVWKLKADGSILDSWCGKSVVKAGGHYNYNQVQGVIDKGSVKEDNEKDLLMLYSIACHLHHKRYHKEAMSLHRQHMEFDNSYQPTCVTIASRPNIAKCVKEFLFLANACVAQKIASQFPDQALLRRQAPPNKRKLNELKSYCLNYLGVPLETSNANSIQSSIEMIEDPELRQLVSILVLKTMQAPSYFCSGVLDISKYMHFATGAPLFTHFTSPLRRFTDIIVHRQLESTLKGDKQFYLDRDTIQKLAQHSNVKKSSSLVAREQGKLLSLALCLVNDRQDTTTSYHYGEEATVIAVMSDAFDISIPRFGIERRIHLSNLPISRHTFDRQVRALTLYWKEGVNPSTGEQALWSLSDDDELDYIENNTTNKRASTISQRLSTSMVYSSDNCSQTIKAMDRIKVIITVQMVKTPPLIRILPANPYA